MMASLFGSRFLGILRDAIMAHQFGRNAVTDSYTLAFMVPDLLFFLIAGGALSSAFIPVFSEYLHTGRKSEAWRVFNSVATLMTAGLLVFIGLSFAFAPQLVAIVVSKEKAEYFPLITHMSRILLPAQLAFFIGGLMFGTLYAHQRFSIPGLGPNIYNIGIIFGALVISQFVQPGIVGMAWGGLIGAFMGNIIIPIFPMLKLGGTIRPSFDTKHEGVRKVFRLMLPVVLGLSLPGVYAIIMRNFGSQFKADGIVTSLELANKLMQAPLAMFGQSFAIAIFPALSQFYAQKKMDMFRDQVERSIRTTLYITIPIAVFMAVFALEIVNLLFGYGKFKESDPSSVVQCLQLFCLGIPAWCLHPILMRAYFSSQNTVKPIVQGTITTFVFILLCLVLKQTPLEWRALPLASSIAAMFLVGLMLSAMKKDLGGLNLGRIGEAVGQCLLAALAVTAALVLVAVLLPGGLAFESVWLTLIRLLSGFVVTAGVYGFLTKRMGMPETVTLDKAMAKGKKVFNR